MKIMAVDFGEARTGLAMCDKGELLASPLGVIQEKGMDKILGKMVEAVDKYSPEMVIVGHPIRFDASEGERAKRCRTFAEKLGRRVTIPVELWDERGTTVSAIGYLNETNTRGKQRKEVLDAVAATIILEHFLQYRKNIREKELL